MRYTYVADDVRYADAAGDLINRLEANGFEPDRPPKNSWGQDGYQGINSTWRDPESGQSFEVQVHTPESLAAKERTHPLYEEQRLLPPDDPRWAELERQQQEIFDMVPRPEGAADVRRPRGAGR